MRAYEKIMFLVVPLLLVFVLLGCYVPERPVEITLPSIGLAEKQRPPRTNIRKRFEQPTEQSQTAVESAIELAKKNAEFAEQAVLLRRKNRELITEIARLKDRIVTIEPQLKQTQKELTEANDLLIEMRIELNNWKADILGFRNEMRQAEKSQLQALLKILKMLGGEVGPESTQAKNESPGATLTAQSSRP